MLDFIVGQLLDYVRDRGIGLLTAGLMALPPWLLPSIIFPALGAWIVVALWRKWRSRKDSNL